MNCGSGSIGTLVLKVGTRCTLVFRFHLWGISLRTCWIRGCMGPKSGHVGVQKWGISIWLYCEWILDSSQSSPYHKSVISIKCELKCWMLFHFIHIWKLVLQFDTETVCHKFMFSKFATYWYFIFPIIAEELGRTTEDRGQEASSRYEILHEGEAATEKRAQCCQGCQQQTAEALGVQDEGSWEGEGNPLEPEPEAAEGNESN